MVLTTSIDSLVDFTAVLAKIDCCFEKIQPLLRSVHIPVEDLKPYAFFSNKHYTRNLIAKSPSYELLLLCWEVGQKTPIHDHSESHCWMLGITGQVRETQYKIIEGNAFNPGISTILNPGEFAYIHDRISLHNIENIADQPSMTLHLYVPSIKTCQYFDVEEKKLKQRILCNYSEYGSILTQ